jgi:hypothetical protein
MVGGIENPLELLVSSCQLSVQNRDIGESGTESLVLNLELGTGN